MAQHQGDREFTGEKQYIENVINIDRVARVVRGGRRFRFRALVVVGDGKNKVGVGVSKASDVQGAVTKAIASAKKSMVEIPMYRTTIPHSIEAKHSGAHVLLKPAGEGTGIIAGGVVRAVIEVTGISDLLSKSLGSSNKLNTAYATLEALQGLKSSKDWITTKSKPASKKPTDNNKDSKKAAKQEVKA
ncbi:MAG: 30S ribosomal protein S5 [Candidatus Saccharimonadales bacterium]|nr:30S ribosomal protein S5 [Candidatus Saccharimonadales bacterium]